MGLDDVLAAIDIEPALAMIIEAWARSAGPGRGSAPNCSRSPAEASMNRRHRNRRDLMLGIAARASDASCGRRHRANPARLLPSLAIQPGDRTAVNAAALVAELEQLRRAGR